MNNELIFFRLHFTIKTKTATMARHDINIKSVLKHVHLYENPDFNFVSYRYDPDYVIVHNGYKTTLADIASSKNDISIEITKNKNKEKIFHFVKNILPIIIFNLIVPLFTSGVVTFTLITNFNIDYLRYIGLLIMMSSTFLTVFLDSFGLFYSKKTYKSDYVSNAIIFDYSKERKCTFNTAIEDIEKIIHSEELDSELNFDEQYGSEYFVRIKKELRSIKHSDNLGSKYNELLNRLLNPTTITRLVFFSLLSVGLLIVNIIEVFMMSDLFKTNIIACLIVSIILSILIPYFLVKIKFKNYCIKMDAFLMLYSFQYLDSPITEKTPFIEDELESADDYYKQLAEIDYKISKLNENYQTLFLSRDVLITKNKIRIYWIKFK